MDEAPTLAGVLQRYLDARGYTQERLARASGVKEETLHHWLSGKTRRPYYVENLLRVARALGLTRSATDRLLLAAGWPTLGVLERAAADAERAALVAHWQVRVPHNLPAEVTSFVGREAEVLEIAELVERDDVRLVTLTGAGGSGKTRLALAVARQARDGYRDGVYVVALAGVSAPAGVLPAVGRALNLQEAPGVAPLARLGEWLRRRRVLLVLDNLEQVLAVGPELVALLRAAPGVTLVVTSRVALRVTGEHVWAVGPLALPAAGQPLTVATAGPAVALFAERATAVAPRFRLTPTTLAPVVAIVRRLDGLPLALELAAARVGQLGPARLLASFPQALDLAGTGPRDVPARQRTLRAAIGWSEQLLEPAVQRLFWRLSVFRGGWTEAAALAVCADAELPAVAVVDGLAALRAASLVAGVAGGRSRMLEPIREYALERLVASCESDAVQRRHACYWAASLDGAPRYVPQTRPAGWFEQVDEERDNLLGALAWAIDAEPEMAVRMVAALWPYWQEYTYLSEGRGWVTRALQLPEAATPEWRARLLVGAFCLGVTQGDFARAMAHGMEGLALAQQLGDDHAVALVLQQSGWLAYVQGKIDESVAYQQQSAERWRRLDDDAGFARCLSDVAVFLATSLRQREAEPFFREARAIFEEAADSIGLARSYTDRGAAALLTGDLRAALPRLQRAVALSRAASVQLILPAALFYLGTTLCFAGNLASAIAPLAESMRLYEAMGNRLLISLDLLAFAAMAHRQGDAGRSARLCGAATRLHGDTGIVLAPGVQALYEREVGLVRDQLDAAAFEAAFEDGARMTMAEAVEYALEVVG